MPYLHDIISILHYHRYSNATVAQKTIISVDCIVGKVTEAKVYILQFVSIIENIAGIEVGCVSGPDTCKHPLSLSLTHARTDWSC